MLEEAGVLPRRGSEAMGRSFVGEQDAHSLMDPQFLQPVALQPNTITTSGDRLLELKLMHRKYALFYSTVPSKYLFNLLQHYWHNLLNAPRIVENEKLLALSYSYDSTL